MSFEFKPARRENVPLLVGLAGYTGSGKTLSALLLARGMAAGKPFAVIDTENGRASHYADDFQFESADLRAPFRPQAYADAIQAADQAGYPVIVVDSMSHEYAGDGGLLDWHDTELTRMAGDDYKKRDALTFAAWVKPKMEHKRMVSKLLQVRAHVILCFRAEEKIEIVKRDGKTIVQPKQTLTGGGLNGWISVTEKTLPYEMTASFLLSPSNPGVPQPMKLQAQHRPFFAAGETISEDAGRLLSEWAAGGAQRSRRSQPAEPIVEREPVDDDVDFGSDPGADEIVELTETLLGLADELGNRQGVQGAVTRNRNEHGDDPAAHMEWLSRQIEKAREKTGAVA